MRPVKVGLLLEQETTATKQIVSSYLARSLALSLISDNELLSPMVRRFNIVHSVEYKILHLLSIYRLYDTSSG